MTPSSPTVRRRAAAHRQTNQRGVVMIITLVALLVLMAGSVALVRSADTAASLAGQLAFRRDLKNQGERGIAQATALLKTGALNTPTARQTNLGSANYSAVKLATNPQGVPSLLVRNSEAFLAAGMTAADIGADGDNHGVTVRTVIDRLCLATGAPTDSACTRVPLDCAAKGGQDGAAMGGTVLKCSGTAYRISVRVDGPRKTQAFFQSVVAL